MATCPAGQHVEQTCITYISYGCVFDPDIVNHCYEDEITFTISNTAGDSIYSSGQQTRATWNGKFDDVNLCSTEFTIELSDSYGDGWNGAYLMFFSGGNLLQVTSDANTVNVATIDNGVSAVWTIGPKPCSDCPAGSYKSTSGPSACTLCENGKYSDVTKSTSSSDCKNCPMGTYADQEGATICKGCPIGQYSTSFGSSVCKSCGDGNTKIQLTITWEKEGDPPQEDNEVGWDIADMNSQTLFSEMSYSATPTTIEFDANKPFYFYTYSANQESWINPTTFSYYRVNVRSSNGLFNIFKVHSAGSLWEFDYYDGIEGATDCICPEGTKVTGDACQSCDAGYYSSAQDATYCQGCLAGKYSTAKAATCQDCPVGYSIYQLNSPSCTQCEAGTYAYKEGMQYCFGCNRGTFQDQIGQSTCKSCPNGKVRDLQSMDSDYCIECDAGKASNQLIEWLEFYCESANCFTGEISWEIQSYNGTVLESGGYEWSPILVYKYAYKIIFKDSYGDGWNGAYVKIHTQRGYVNYVSGTDEISIVDDNALITHLEGDFTMFTFVDPGDTSINTTGVRIERAVCNECLDGYYSEDGSETCTICPAGKVSSSAKDECVCPAGYEASGDGCSICQAGRYREFEDTDGCKLCQAGTHSIEDGLSECASCVPGKFSNEGSQYCTLCETGKYSLIKSDTCTDCNGYTTYTVIFTFKKFGSPSMNATWKLTSSSGATLFGPFTADSTTTLNLRTDRQYRIYRYSSEEWVGWANDNDNRYSLSVYSSNEIFNNHVYNHNGPNSNNVTFKNWYTTVPSSWMSNYIGGDACICSPGFYQDAISCSPCQAGTFSISENVLQCTECPIGTYTSQTQSTQCDACTSGKTTLQVSSSSDSQCVQCSKGRYSKPIGKCIRSVQFTTTGTYTYEVTWTLLNSLTGNSVSGVFDTSEQIINDNYDTLVLEDSYGDGWNGNKMTIQHCEGTYATASDFSSNDLFIVENNEITFEEPGNTNIKTTSVFWTSIECVTCAAGTYSDVTHASQCQQCPEGRVIDDDGGTASLHDAIDDCEACPTGTEFHSNQCQICSAGQYSHVIEGTCQQCPEGRYNIDQGSPSRLNHDSVDDCLFCPAGTEFVDRTTACQECPIGQIQPYSGLPSAKCRMCPFGKTTTTKGASECVKIGKQVFTGIFRACLLEDNEFICWGRDDIPMEIGYKRQGPYALTGHIFCPTPLKNDYNCPSWYGMDFYWDYFNRPDNNVYALIRAYVSEESKQIDNIYLLGPITCVLFGDSEFNCWSTYQYTKTLHLEGVQSVSIKQKRDNYVYNGKEHAGGTQNTLERQQSANSRYGQWRAWDFKHIMCVIIDYTPSCYDLRALYAQETNFFNYMVEPLTPAEMPTWATYNQNLIEAEDYVRGDIFEPVKGVVSVNIETGSWVSSWGTYYEPKKSESTCTEGYTDLQCCYEYIEQIGWSSGSYTRPGYRDYFGTSLYVADWNDVMPYGCFLALDINGRVIGGGRSYFNTNLLSLGIDDSIWQAKRWTSAGGRNQQYESKQEEMMGSLHNWDMEWSTPTYSFVYGRPWQTTEQTTYTTPYQDSSAQRMYGDCVQRTYSHITCIDGINIKGEIVGFSPNEDNRVVYYQNISDNTIGYIYDGNIFKSNITVKGIVSVGMFEACSIGLDDDKVICWTNPNIDLTFVSMYDREETWTFTDISNPILNEPPTPYIFLGSGKCMDKTNEQEYQLSGSVADPIEECMNKCGELTGGFYMNTARNKCYCVQENCVPLGRRLYIPIGIGIDYCGTPQECQLRDDLAENRQWDSYVKRVSTLEYKTKKDMYWQPHSPVPFEYPIGGCDDDDKDGVCNENEVMGCTRPKSCTWQEHFTESPPKGHYHECGYPFDSVNYECHPTERGKYRLDELTDTWVRNPGRCIHSGGDEDGNGWCDQLDEIIGCLDVRACNYDGCLDTNACPRIIGDICDVNADCMSEQCTWCNGAYRCTLPPENPGDRLSCNRNSVTNMDYITRHNANFCRMPYGRSFKCTLFNRQFSSMKGVPIENAGNKTYLSMTPENRKKMIRCLNVDDRCGSIDEFQCDSDEENKFYPRNVCCQCGGGRVFDTSRGEPLYDRDSDTIPDDRQELQCNDPKACNFDVTSGYFASNKTCKYNDEDGDGVCDDLYDTYTMRCGVFGAINYKESLLKTEAYDNSICIFPEVSQTCLSRPFYKSVFGCMDNFACNFNFAATQSNGQCTYIQPRQTCEGEPYHVVEQCFMTDSDILNGNIGTCTGVFFDGETCAPMCDLGYLPSTTSVTCENGKFSTFSCTLSENCIGPAVGQYVSSPCTPNTTTVLSNCSTPNINQFVVSPCIPGNSLENGTNAVIQDCSTPQTGQYVVQACSYDIDTQFGVCSTPEITENIVSDCSVGNITHIGQNTILQDKNCSELYQEYTISSTDQCTENSQLLKLKWNQECLCDGQRVILSPSTSEPASSSSTSSSSYRM